jgi:hypothetical protein
MSQHDMNIANGPGATFRADLNNALAALVSQSSGAVAPSPTYPCQLWADTGTGRIRQRDSANTQWFDLGPLDTASRYPGRLIGVQVFTANGTYTPTSGLVTAVIEAQGGGAAGAGLATPSAGNVSLGAPGTSGSYAKGRFTAAAIGASQAVTVGLGGTAASNTAGGNGGTSSVGSLITAPGGVGGGLLNNQTPGAYNGNGSSAGTPTGASIVQSIGTCPGLSTSISAGSAQAAAGGASLFGGGGIPPVINSNGTASPNYGAGGSGVAGGSGSANLSGGAGKAGIVIIWEYA